MGYEQAKWSAAAIRVRTRELAGATCINLLAARSVNTPFRVKGGNMRFWVTLERDEDGVWVAECPAIPGCVSQGATREDALQNVQEAIQLCLQVRAEQGLPLTVETRQVEVLACCQLCPPSAAKRQLAFLSHWVGKSPGSAAAT